MKYLLLWIKSN